MASKARTLLIDIEGTIAFQGKPIPGAAAAIRRLRDAGYGMKFLTNKDSTTVASLHERLADLGLPVEAGELFTPVDALVEFGARHPGAAFHLIVVREIRDYLESRLKIVEDKPDYVVIGDTRDCAGFEEMDRSLDFLMAGARLIGLQPGRFFLREDHFHIDTGGYIKMLEYASGRRALILGKPSPHFFRLAIHALGGDPETTAVIGDDVTTDVAGAKRIGSLAVAVKTGKYGLTPDKARTPVPDFAVDSFADVPDLLATLPARG